MHNRAFNVCNVFVMFQSLGISVKGRFKIMQTYTLKQSSFLAQIGDARAVVVAEHVVSKDSIRHLRGVHKVEFKKPCLEMTLFGLVIFEGVQEEGGGWLDHILRHEDVNDLEPVNILPIA